MKNELLAKGRVEGLCVNGMPVGAIRFTLEGPAGDSHSGLTRQLSGHDGAYRHTSELTKGDTVFNWRSWTGVSREELAQTAQAIGRPIPPGCLLENVVFSGVPNFSQLAPTSRLVFPKRESAQAILAVWEENGPCHTVGQRLADHYGDQGLQKCLIAEAKGKRGVMGFVLSAGRVELGDVVLVYPPAQ